MMRERSGWRELDSNHRSRGRPRRSRGIGSRLRRLSVGGESSRADMSPSRNLLSRGTDGSNPASSREESTANLISGVHPRAAFRAVRERQSAGFALDEGDRQWISKTEQPGGSPDRRRARSAPNVGTTHP
jgi:hypothetical protein